MANALENLIADTLVRGRVEGVAVGKAEGIAEGMASGRREAILGPLPDGLRAEIALVADGPTLGQLLVAASAANSLEEFRSAPTAVAGYPRTGRQSQACLEGASPPYPIFHITVRPRFIPAFGYPPQWVMQP